MPFWRGNRSEEPPAPTLPTYHGKKHLPQPRGPRSVGFVDLMTPGQPNEGVFTRIYYPTTEQCLDEHNRWAVWTQSNYVAGFLPFAQSMLQNWPSWAPRDEYAYVNVIQHISPFIPRFGFAHVFWLVNGKIYIPIIEKARLDSSQRWPLVIFSHGIGCSRFMYSRICYDLASFGFIVAATEHRDGSSCQSFFKTSLTGDKHWIPHRPVSKHEDEYQVRNSQVHDRAQEVIRTLDVMLALNEGKEVTNVYESDFEFSVFKNAMDVQRPLLTGHSFGGATSLLAMGLDRRFYAGIVLDGWLFPIRDEALKDKVEQPVLFINTESFLSDENQQKIAEFGPQDNCERHCLVIKGSVHQNHLDLPFIFQRSLIRRVMGMQSQTCPERIIDINNKLMVQFLWRHLGLAPDNEIEESIKNSSDLLREGFLPPIPIKQETT